MRKVSCLIAFFCNYLADCVNSSGERSQRSCTTYASTTHFDGTAHCHDSNSSRTSLDAHNLPIVRLRGQHKDEKLAGAHRLRQWISNRCLRLLAGMLSGKIGWEISFVLLRIMNSIVDSVLHRRVHGYPPQLPSVRLLPWSSPSLSQPRERVHSDLYN